MNRRRFRIGIGLSAGAAVLLIVVVVVAPMLVPREKLRRLAEQEVATLTGGDVSLGPVSLRVLPRIRLVLGASSVEVTRDGLVAAGQDAGPLLTGSLTLEKLEVDLAIGPLLRRRLEFGEIQLVAPRITLVTEAVDSAAAAVASEPGTTAAPPAENGDPAAFGLALATVEVRDGQLEWREEPTGRTVRVTGWHQELAADGLSLLLQRLSRISGAPVDGDGVPGTAELRMTSRVAMIELTGFGGTETPPLRDLRLRAGLAADAAADHVVVVIDELVLGDLALSARGIWAPDGLVLDDVSLHAAEAAALTGHARVVLPPRRGPLRLMLSGEIELGGMLALVGPWMPARPDTAPPLPTVAGRVNLDIDIELTDPPSFDDAVAWQEAWQAGLRGRVDVRATGGPLRIKVADLDDAVEVHSLTIASDLRSAAGRTRITCDAISHPAMTAAAKVELVAPPGSGPLFADITARGDLTEIMAAVTPLLPPRDQDAPPLPTMTGVLDLAVNVDLPAAPSLADTAAWRAAWENGLSGRADLAAHGGPLTIDIPELGDPLRVQNLRLVSDLRSPQGVTRLEATGLDHAVLRGDASMTVVPAASNGAIAASLDLPSLDLDALAAISEAGNKSRDQHTSSQWSFVSTAWATEAAPPAVGDLIPPDLSVDLDAMVAELVFLKSRYTAVEVRGTLRERVIDVPEFVARLGAGRIDGRARIDYAADSGGRASWTVGVVDAPAGVLLAPYVSDLATVWTGSLDADLEGHCDLADPEAIRSSLTVDGDVSGRDGSIDLRRSLGGAARYLGDRQDLLHVAYDLVRQHIRVEDGRVHVEDLRLQGQETDWIGNGWIGLDGTLDVALNVRLPAGFTPDLGDLSFLAEGLRDDDGRVALDFQLTGQSRSPTVALNLDPAEMLKSDEVREGLEDEVKKGLGGLLDRLKGR